MKNGIKTDFDELYEALNECYLVEGTFEVANKNIARYIIPQNVKEDNNGNIKVREDNKLPNVSWRTLSDFSTIGKNENSVETKNKSGIYVIKNDLTNQLYFGKASDFTDRLSDHEKGREADSKFLHAAVNHARSHPEEGSTFSWAIYYEVDKDTDALNKAEIEAINDPRWDTYNSPYDYNLTPGGDGSNPFDYKDYPEVYDMIAQMLYKGMKSPDIIAYMNSSPDSPIVKYNLKKLKDNSITSEVNKVPWRYKKFIHNYDEITTVLDNGKVVIRSPEVSKANKLDNLYDSSQAVNLYVNNIFIKKFDTIKEASEYVYNLEKSKLKNSNITAEKIADAFSKKDHNYSWGMRAVKKRYSIVRI